MLNLKALSHDQTSTMHTITSPSTHFFGVKSISLRSFRNFDTFDHTLHSQSILLVAPNGSGKTNILEALSLFSPGKGLRQASFKDMQHQSHSPVPSNISPWQVGISLSLSHHNTWEDDIYLGTTLKTEGAQEKRLVKHNGTPLKQHSLLTDYVSVVWFIPTMGHLFLESGSTQRQFLDRLVFSKDPHHAKRRSAYDKVLRERNKILSDYGPISHGVWLDTLEDHLAGLSIDIVHARSLFIKDLMEHQNTCHAFPKFTCSMEGEAETLVADHPTRQSAHDALKEEFAKRRKQDSIRRGTSLGPHRGTFLVKHLGKNQQASLCSTGEQKILVLAILLATLRSCSHAQSTHNPGLLLLLDDVFDHLDSQHRHVLLKEIAKFMAHSPLQLWMTSANAIDFQGIEDFLSAPQWIDL